MPKEPGVRVVPLSKLRFPRSDESFAEELSVRPCGRYKREGDKKNKATALFVDVDGTQGSAEMRWMEARRDHSWAR